MSRPVLRSRSRRLVALAAVVVAAVILLADVANAAVDSGESGARAARPARSSAQHPINVVQVQGLIDTPNASLIRRAIRDANTRRSTALILQIDSSGGVDVDVQSIVRDISRSSVPVVAWVGPSGAKAKGAAALIVEASHVASVSSGSGIGPASPLLLDHPSSPNDRVIGDQLAHLASLHGRSPAGARRLVSKRLSADAAARVRATNTVRPTLGELIVGLDGTTVKTATGTVKLSTATVVGKGRGRRRQPKQEAVFAGLSLDGRALHTLISPSVAYMLFVFGLALMIFEFYTAAIGLAGLTGAIALVGALVGFSHLPVHWWAAGLLMLGLFGFAVDVQAGGLGAWTIIGGVSLVAGSLTLYGGSSRLDPRWWIIVVVCGGTALFMLWGMTAMIRARFSTPTIGRSAIIGELGDAEADIDPDGVVTIRGARWRARTNRATPIKAGDRVRVVEVVGRVLEVEPETGGARDHRESRGRSKTTPA